MFSEELIIYLVDNEGAIAEYASIILPSSVSIEYAFFLPFAEDDNALFCYSSGTFCIVSIENKRVDLEVNEVDHFTLSFTIHYQLQNVYLLMIIISLLFLLIIIFQDHCGTCQ